MIAENVMTILSHQKLKVKRFKRVTLEPFKGEKTQRNCYERIIQA